MKILWTKKQLDELLEIQERHNLPQEVVDNVKQVLNVLDDNYGTDRNFETDYGGYVALILTDDKEELDKKYFEIIKKHNLYNDEPEIEKEICLTNDKGWYSDLYIVSSDYGVTIVYQVDEEDKYDWFYDMHGCRSYNF